MSYEDGWRESPEWHAVEKAVQDFVSKHEETIESPMVSDYVLAVVMVPSSLDSEWSGGYTHFCTNDMPHVGEGLASRAARYFADLGAEVE